MGGPGATNIQAATFFDYGPNFPIMLSGDAGNPLTAVRGPTADTVGPCRIAETVVLADLSVNLFFRAVNQLGSLIMRTNASGARTDVEQYTEHGGVLQYPVVFDGQKSLISSVTSNSPESGITNLHLTSGLLTSGALKGMTLVVSVLDIDSNTLRIGRVVDNDTDDIWVLDDDSIAGAIYHHGAIQNGFVVCKQQDANEVLTSGAWDTVLFANPDTDLIDTGVGTASAVGQWVSLPNGTWAEIISIPNANTVRVSGDRTEIVAASDPYVISKLPYTNLAYSTAGQWTAESFASSETTLTDASATFNSYMVGWQIIIDMEFPMPLTITAVPSATTLKVAGDVRTLTDPGKFYILFAPPKVNPADGTLATIVTEGEDDEWYDVTGSLYLWAGYRYVPPMVGFNDAGTTRGAQAGNNKLGNYHCNNRVYSIGHGRWLTPDQASRPSWHLLGYARNSLQFTDPAGLSITIEGDAEFRKAMIQAIQALCPMGEDEGAAIHVNPTTGQVMFPSDFCDRKVKKKKWVSTCRPEKEGTPSDHGRVEEVEEDVPGSWRSVEGHSKGCELMACLLCSDYPVVLRKGGSGKVNYGDVPKGAKSDAYGDTDKPGKGTGSSVEMPITPSTYFDSVDPNTGKPCVFLPSLARLLAHEFGHACDAIKGTVRTGNCPLGKYRTAEEHDSIVNWENPIAEELKRANHPGEKGYARQSHGGYNKQGQPKAMGGAVNKQGYPPCP